MVDTPLEQAGAGRDLDLDRVLLESKVRAPSPRPDAVSRHALISRANASGASIVALAAPAGYGKSTLLAEWAASETRAVGWVSPDHFDDDPATLLSLVASACAHFSPSAAAVVADMRDRGGSVLGRSAPLLASALAQTAAPFVLFIDDLHHVASPGCQDALEVALRRIPDGSQVVLASRHHHDLLAGLRVSGRVVEIGPEDLRLGPAEARIIFDAAGRSASRDDIERMVMRCGVESLIVV